MEQKYGKIFGMAAVAALWVALAVMAWCRPAQAFSTSERRELEQFPKITAENLLDGRFMSDFESYTLDQFPLRDGFRSLKALTHYKVFGQRDHSNFKLVFFIVNFYFANNIVCRIVIVKFLVFNS